MAWHDVREWLTRVIAAGALSAVILAGLLLPRAAST
jgi:hypothetical protein